MGCTSQWAEDSYVARNAAVKAGLPISTPAYTVNRLCASGLEAIVTAARWIETGDAEIVVAGGTENMSMLPHYVRGARWGELRLADGILQDGVQALLTDPLTRYHMGVTAENLVAQFDISRQDMDKLALESHQRAVASIEQGHFKDQVVPITVRSGRETKVIDTDEGPRADTSLEALSRLRAIFQEGGSVTAGNASQLNDGAAAVVVASRRKAEELDLRPRLRLVARAVAGVEPSIMGTGPIPAVSKVLDRAGMALPQMDVVELNEAFSAVALTCIRELGLDPEKTNPNGGAIALGHPVGATGAILTVKLMYELERRRERFGLVTMCVGGGQGIAAIFERLS